LKKKTTEKEKERGKIRFPPRRNSKGRGGHFFNPPPPFPSPPLVGEREGGGLWKDLGEVNGGRRRREEGVEWDWVGKEMSSC